LAKITALQKNKTKQKTQNTKKYNKEKKASSITRKQ